MAGGAVGVAPGEVEVVPHELDGRHGLVAEGAVLGVVLLFVADRYRGGGGRSVLCRGGGKSRLGVRETRHSDLSRGGGCVVARVFWELDEWC